MIQQTFTARFYRAALNTGRYSREKDVCLSIRPFVKRVDYDKTEEISVQIFHHKKDHLAYFFDKKNGWWGVDL